VKDEMSREILRGLDEAGIGIASATYEMTGVPPLVVATPALRTTDAAGAVQP
jgi:hypothetical protein